VLFKDLKTSTNYWKQQRVVNGRKYIAEDVHVMISW